MGFVLPARALANQDLHPLFLNETVSNYKKLFYIKGDPTFIKTDFWQSMSWKPAKKSHSDLLNSSLFSTIEKTYTAFCDNALSSLDYVTPPQTSKIPPILHFIWLGSQLPLFAKLSIQSWQMQHPGWEIKLWDDVAVETFQWSDTRCKNNFYQASLFAEKADILRYEILYQYGGIYSDTDVVCLKPFHHLLTENLEFFTGIETNNTPLHVATGIIGASKGSDLLKYCIDHHMGKLEAPDVTILERTGPALFSLACNHILSSKTTPNNHLVLPVTYFYPLPFKNRNIPIDQVQDYIQKESMAIHLWNSSWLQ
ncbi:MAG: glycosyltransferase [Chlamydiota bacterium]